MLLKSLGVRKELLAEPAALRLAMLSDSQVPQEKLLFCEKTATGLATMSRYICKKKKKKANENM